MNSGCKLTCIALIGVLICTSCSTKHDSEIAAVAKALESKQKTVTQVLADPALMELHPEPAFREAIKAHAPVGQIDVTGPNEPGLKTGLQCVVVDKGGQPLSDILVYFYQASDKGWYALNDVHASGEGGDEAHARLFGYVKTDANGTFEIHTIRPNGVPDTELPEKIVFKLFNTDGTEMEALSHEFQFSDAPRMTVRRRDQSKKEGALVSENRGRADYARYHYIIIAKV